MSQLRITVRTLAGDGTKMEERIAIALSAIAAVRYAQQDGDHPALLRMVLTAPLFPFTDTHGVALRRGHEAVAIAAALGLLDGDADRDFKAEVVPDPPADQGPF